VRFFWGGGGGGLSGLGGRALLGVVTWGGVGVYLLETSV